MTVFLAVVDEGGFTAAARRLAMTVPHVTRHVAALEEQLGSRLLQRTTRSVSLTPSGERYAARVRDILEAVDSATTEVQSRTSALSGVLRIVATPSLTDAIISPLAADFRKRYPDIALDVHVDPGLTPDMNRYDLGLMQVLESFNASLVARKLSTSDSVLYAAPSYLQSHGAPQSPQELGQHQFVLRRRHEQKRDSIALWHSHQHTDEAPIHNIEVTAAVTISSTASILQMVLDGTGIAEFTQDAARPFLNEGLLQPVLPGWITGRLHVLMALPSRKHIPPRTKAFMDFVAQAHQAGRIDRC